MYHALIVACALAYGECTAFKDTYGPYASEAECIERLDQRQPQIEHIVRQHGRSGPYRLERYGHKAGEGA